LSIIPLPKKGEPFNEKMHEWTARAFKCSSPFALDPVAKRGREDPIPSRVGGKSPIRSMIYVIKENRTYDQVLGDMPEGNGDSSLCLFAATCTRCLKRKCYRKKGVLRVVISFLNSRGRLPLERWGSCSAGERSDP
jgi:hypothetical protein